MWQKLTRGPFLEGPEKAQQNLKPFISVLWAFIPDVLGVYTSLLHFIVDNNSNAKLDNSICIRLSV